MNIAAIAANTAIDAGRYFLGAQPYTLFVAPASEGEVILPWGTRKSVPGAIDPEDGLANTEAMLAASNKLAQWARALRIDGCDDWYLPSRLELFHVWLRLRDTEHVARDWYWTSTQHASHPESAWLQLFGLGGQLSSHKDGRYRARAVRRVPICSFDPSVIANAEAAR
ncbi:MAG: hypothetical protein WC809_18685 [Sinimarinibacterium sp.]|jgi:hypothetical protein